MEWWNRRNNQPAVSVVKLQKTVEDQSRQISQLMQMQQQQQQWSQSQWSGGQSRAGGNRRKSGGMGNGPDGMQCGLAGGESLSGRWRCWCKDCPKSASGATNNPGRTSCFGCGRPKNQAKNPPASNSLKPAANTAADPVAQPAKDTPPPRRKRRSRNKDKEEKDAPADEPARGNDAMDADTPPPAASEVTPTKEEHGTLASLGITPITSKMELKKIFCKPNAYAPAQTAEEEVATTCGKSDSEPMEIAKANVQMYKTLMEEGTSRADWDLLKASVEGHLKEWEQKLTTLQDKKPDDKVILTDLHAKKTSDDSKETKRVQAVEKKTENAVAKHKRLRDCILKQQELLAGKLKALDDEFAEVQEAWAKDEASRTERHTLRMAAWTSRITCATPAAGIAPPGTPMGATPATPAVPPTPPPAPQPDYQLAVKWNITDIPTFENAAQEDQLKGLNTLWCNVQAWMQCGSIPVTYQQLYTGCADKMSVVTTKAMIGEAIWEKFYANREVGETNLVPMQLISILRTALGKFEDQFKADQVKANKVRAKFDKFFEQDIEDKAQSRGAYGLQHW